MVAILRYSLKPRVPLLHHPGFLSNSAQTKCVCTESNIRIIELYEKKSINNSLVTFFVLTVSTNIVRPCALAIIFKLCPKMLIPTKSSLLKFGNMKTFGQVDSAKKGF